MSFTKYRLGDIATISISGVDKKAHKGEIPVKLCNFVDVYYNWAITKDLLPSFMSATARQSEIDEFTIHKGSVAITKDSETRDDIGVATYIADDFDETVVLGYHTALITPNPSILDGRYLNALLHTSLFQRYWYNNASGSGQRYTLGIEAMQDALVYLPDIAVQRRIGEAFSILDRKISILEKENETLENLAKQIHDYWFIQFDYPNAEGKPYKTSGGRMEYDASLKRDIPQGWEVRNLPYIAVFTNGVACQKYRPQGNDTGLPVIKILDMHNKRLGKTERVRSSIPDSVKVFNGDILFSWSASLEVMIWAYGEGGLNQHIFKVTTNNGFPKYYVYYQLLHYVQNFRRIAESRKTTMGHITSDHLKQSTIAVPSDIKICNDFNDKVSPIFDKIIKNCQEINELNTVRDYILPLLMNGQATIKE